ncbi:hypothetical protein [Nocardioides gilvus]|nr:hypothetical protein [Nocardioides gilvus]
MPHRDAATKISPNAAATHVDGISGGYPQQRIKGGRPAAYDEGGLA